MPTKLWDFEYSQPNVDYPGLNDIGKWSAFVTEDGKQYLYCVENSGFSAIAEVIGDLARAGMLLKERDSRKRNDFLFLPQCLEDVDELCLTEFGECLQVVDFSIYNGKYSERHRQLKDKLGLR